MAKYTASFCVSYRPEDGADAINVDLTNENSVIVCDSQGKVTGEYETTTVMVTEGSLDVTDSAEVTISAENITAEYDSSTHVITVSDITADSATVTVTAVYSDTTKNAYYRIKKLYAGADGETPTVYSLSPQQPAIYLDSNGDLKSTYFYVYVKKTDADGPSMLTTSTELTAESLYLYYKVDGGTTYTRINNSYNRFAPSSSKTYYTFCLYQGGTYSTGTLIDEETVYVVKDGSSSLRIDLSNEVEPVLSDSNGTVLESSIAGTTATLYYGATNVTSSATWSCTASGITASITTAGVVTVSSMTADKATVTITAAYNGSTISTVYSLYKTATAKYSLQLSTNAVTISSDGTASVSTITATILLTTGEGTTSITSGAYSTYGVSLLYALDGATTSTGYSTSGTLSVTPSSSNSSIEFYLVQGQGASAATIADYTILDQETVPIVKDGADGADGADGKDGADGADGAAGADGADGTSPCHIILTNEAEVVACDGLGNVTDTSSIEGTSWTFYEGLTVIAVEDYTYTVTKSGCTVTTTVSGTTGTITVTAMSGDTATVTVAVTYEGNTYSRAYTLTKNYGNLSYAIVASPSVISVDADGNLNTATLEYAVRVNDAGTITTYTDLSTSGSAYTKYGLYLYRTYKDGTSYTRLNSSTGSLTLSTYASNIISYGGLTLYLYQGGTYSTGTLVDKEGIELVTDGAAGADGADGAAGADGQDGTNGADGADGKDGADGEDGPTYTFSPVSVTLTATTDDDGYPTGALERYTLTVNTDFVAYDNDGNQVTIDGVTKLSATNCDKSSSVSSTKIVIVPNTRSVTYTASNGTSYTYTLAYSSGEICLAVTIGEDIFNVTIAWVGDVSLTTGGFTADKAMLKSVYAQVTENVANISTLTQTATEIQSTVGSYSALLYSEGGVNLFTNSVLNLVSKKVLGASYPTLSATVESGKTYTLTVKACLSETFTAATTNAAIRVYLSGGVTLSTTYLYFTSTEVETQSITFTATSDATTYLYIYTGTYSSSFSSSSSLTSSYYHIYRVQLEEGESFSGWSLADGESTVKSNILSTDITELVDSDTYAVTTGESITVDSETVTLDYATIDTGAETTFLTATIAKNLMTYSKTYTLSFYAKCTDADNPDTITAALYRSTSTTTYNVDGGIAADGTLIEYTDSTSTTGSGETTVELSTSWKRYSIRWTMYPSTYAYSYLHTLKLTSANGDVLIAGIKLERYGEATSYFDTSYYSQITQTARSISLKVSAIEEGLEDTGIDITAGTITLTASNTVFLNSSKETIAIFSDDAINANLITKYSTQFTYQDSGTGTMYFQDDDGNISSSPSKTLIMVNNSGSMTLDADSSQVGKLMYIVTSSDISSTTGCSITYATTFTQSGTTATATVGAGGGIILLMGCLLKSGSVEDDDFTAGWVVLNRYNPSSS